MVKREDINNGTPDDHAGLIPETQESPALFIPDDFFPVPLSPGESVLIAPSENLAQPENDQAPGQPEPETQTQPEENFTAPKPEPEGTVSRQQAAFGMNVFLTEMTKMVYSAIDTGSVLPVIEFQRVWAEALDLYRVK